MCGHSLAKCHKAVAELRFISLDFHVVFLVGAWRVERLTNPVLPCLVTCMWTNVYLWTNVIYGKNAKIYPHFLKKCKLCKTDGQDLMG